MAKKTYQLGVDADGQPLTRVVFTKQDGTDVVVTGDYTTDDPDEQAFLDTVGGLVSPERARRHRRSGPKRKAD